MKQKIQKPILSALFSALIAVGAVVLHFPLPFSPVPIVLATYFMILSGTLLGWKWGLATVSLYLILGFIGLPVFSGGKAGIGTLLGPTGGYLVGYLISVVTAGLISAPHKGRNLLRIIIAVISATLILYLCGVPWLKISAKLSWKNGVLFGMTPFLIGDLIKGIAAVFTTWFLIPLLYKKAENE